MSREGCFAAEREQIDSTVAILDKFLPDQRQKRFLKRIDFSLTLLCGCRLTYLGKHLHAVTKFTRHCSEPHDLSQVEQWAKVAYFIRTGLR